MDKLTEHSPERFTPSQRNQDRLYNLSYHTKEHLEFCGWSMTNFHLFVENTKFPLYCKPFDKNEKSMENWIKESKSKAQSLSGSGFEEHDFFRWNFVYPLNID